MKAKLGENGHVHIKCPGCKCIHVMNTSPANGRPAWSFNGDTEKPTFHPSLLCRTGHYVSGQKQPPDCWLCNNPDESDRYSYACGICHSFIKDGMIQFLDDCTHHLKGQTVPLEDFV